MNQVKLNIDSILTDIQNEMNHLPNELKSCVNEIVSEIYYNKIQHIEDVDFSISFNKVEKIILKRVHGKKREEKNLICKFVLLNCAKKLPKLIKTKKFPDGVIKLYPIYLEKILDRLSNFQDIILDESYSSDLQVSMGVSVPCGAQIVDLRSRIPIKSIIKTLVLNQNLGAMKKYLKILGWGRWFRIHTDSNYLVEFNEKGWDSCYVRISKMLENDPDARGMVGTSWFYDPQLLNISKHLSYLQQTPLSNGAFLIKHGTSEVDIERALRTSRTRKKLYNEGRYIPTCYSLIWPRERMISWSRSMRQ